MRRVAVAALLSLLLLPGPGRAQTPTASGDTAGAVNLFDSAFERIRKDAVDPVADSKLVASAIGGMLSGLDPHAAYLDPAQAQAAQLPVGSADDVGLVISVEHSLVKVISPRDGSPAATAGVKPGDLIFAIDHEPTWDLNLAQAEQKLAGPPGSQVQLTLRRGTSPMPVKLTIARARWQPQTVRSRLDGGDIGYLRLAGFDAGTAAALDQAVAELKTQSKGKLIGLVLDLRNNPGGSFDAAVTAADKFLDKGDVAVIDGRDGSVKRIAATPADIAKGLPIVALVNSGTARDAELVAGALQDNHRAILLGSKTYGESAIETLIPLKSGGAVRLTTARFATPGGHQIDGKGLTPDIEVQPLKIEEIAEGDIQREADLPGALPNPNKEPPANVPPGTTPAQERHPAAAAVATPDLGSKSDEQLTQAEDVLRGLARYTSRTGG